MKINDNDKMSDNEYLLMKHNKLNRNIKKTMIYNEDNKNEEEKDKNKKKEEEEENHKENENEEEEEIEDENINNNEDNVTASMNNLNEN